MENIALIESFSEFKDDKFIDRVTLMAILEDVFRNALKKKFGSDENFDIITNDMKMDYNDSIDILIGAKPFLKKGGIRK